MQSSSKASGFIASRFVHTATLPLSQKSALKRWKDSFKGLSTISTVRRIFSSTVLLHSFVMVPYSSIPTVSGNHFVPNEDGCVGGHGLGRAGVLGCGERGSVDIPK